MTREVAKSIEVVVPDHEPHFTGAPMSGALVILRSILRLAAEEDDWEQWVTTRHEAPTVEERGKSIILSGLKTLMLADRLRNSGSCWS